MTTVLQLGEMPSYLQGLLDSEYALLVLLAVFVLEGAMLMYIMPSELIVPGAILLIGDTTQLVSPTNLLIIGIAVMGATTGQYLLFKLAERGGRDYLLGKRWFRISEEKLDKFDGWFQRWGPVVVPLSNTMLFTRGMLTVPAGFSELDGRKFLVLSAVGTLSFQVILAGLFVFWGRLL
ncbi:membrane protein DedA, SNARE-associated domain [Halogranum gelatinilyticum]|uniref:Membrane protein DedA, SNARE-associated domain n=1 Tax=Halogranum gelatinilyticum TaxID=660521 RepID=A0A1G9P413_9EURY|nr:VTT domain-containing protein [Halogranum gelatinilyticum]SDL92935.1 membrane protein DedA, SNARE-associated domain [Halogranum gelatinilyticum]